MILNLTIKQENKIISFGPLTFPSSFRGCFFFFVMSLFFVNPLFLKLNRIWCQFLNHREVSLGEFITIPVLQIFNLCLLFSCIFHQNICTNFVLPWPLLSITFINPIITCRHDIRNEASTGGREDGVGLLTTPPKCHIAWLFYTLLSELWIGGQGDIVRLVIVSKEREIGVVKVEVVSQMSLPSAMSLIVTMWLLKKCELRIFIRVFALHCLCKNCVNVFMLIVQSWYSL